MWMDGWYDSKEPMQDLLLPAEERPPGGRLRGREPLSEGGEPDARNHALARLHQGLADE
jgi:hypothetical protein